MQNYIKIYENVISKTFCENLIEKFESSKTQQLSWPKDKPFFTQINFSQITDHIVKYKKDCEIDKNQWPTKYSLEPIRMKRYLPNDSDEFPPHVDVDASRNISRFLVFFLYLTTNEKGGTVFPSMSFDSPWPWLHQGMKPIIQSKYIVGSYLHYVN